MRCISCGPGADSGESTESKVPALGPTLDALAAFDAFDALDAEAPEGAWGGSLDLMSWGGTVGSCDSLDAGQAPNLMTLIHRNWHPRTFDADTTPRCRWL